MLLRRPAFARLWLAGTVSEIGDWLLLIALPVYVLQLTGSALVTSTVFVLELAAAVLAGPLAGVLADRWDRRRTLVGCSGTQAALLLPLLAVDGRGELWIVYAVVALEAVLATLNEPVRQALLPAVVGPDELTAAAGQLGVGANIARLVGGALGGLLLEAYGLGGVVLGDAATFLLAAAVLTGRTALGPVPARPAATGPAERAARAWVAGLAVVRDRRALRGTLTVTALMALAQGAFVVLFVVFVLRELGGGGSEVGLLRGVQAVGGILGGLAVGWLARRLGAAVLVGAGLGVFALIDAAIWNGPAATTALPLYVALFAAAGAPAIVIMSGLTSVLLSATPEDFRGRVVSTHAGVFAVLQAAGMLLAGLLVEPVGLLPLLNAQVAVLALGAVVAVLLPRSVPAPPAASAASAGSAAEPGRPVPPDHPAEHDPGSVGAAVVGQQGVVALQPPAAVDAPDGPLHDEAAGAGREAPDHDVAGPDPTAAPDQECVAVPQGRHHRRADHQHSLDGPAE
jgi:MFS family permease